MEPGPILALLTAVFYAMNAIFTRRGVTRTGESFSALAIAMVADVIIFSLAVTIVSDWNKVWSISWQGFALLGGAGIMQTVVGRFLYLASIRLIGANKAATLVKTNALYAVTLGIIVLNESLTIPFALGILCIIIGLALVSTEKQGVSEEKKGGPSRTRVKGVALGLGAGLSWGLSVVMIKPGITEIGSPFAGVFVTYVTASLVIAILLLRQEYRGNITKLRRSALIPLTFAGVCTSAANLFRFPALSYGQVSLVTPIVGTDVIFVLLFSFLLNRNLEVFTWRIIIGILVAFAGVFILTS
jgi:drug/metabolite transporter (DMT)-like permease